MSRAAVLDLKQVVAALLGAVLALAGQWIVARARRAATSRSLSIAFWEELSAAQFVPATASKSLVRDLRIGGFSSQTFDSLFHEMAVTLPDSLARDLMRYHWRAKFLMEEWRTHSHIAVTFTTFYDEVSDLRDALLPRLKAYGSRTVLGLTLRREE